MIIYSACYTDCTHEYGPAMFSLHETRAGAERAIDKSKQQSYENYKEACKHYPSDREWNPVSGSLCEQWDIIEMIVEK